MLRGRSIPVVMYHHISPVDRELSVYPEIFEDHLKTLACQGWMALSGEEFLYFLEHQKEKPKRCVLLTFDDGFADNYVYAYPILKKYGMKAMLFVATDFIEDTDIKRDRFVPLSHNPAWELAHTERRSEVMCTWKELLEMENSGVFDIQAHGMSHRTPGHMQAGRYGELREDLRGGKAILEEKLSKRVLHFAWPSGYYDAEGVKAALDIGFKALYTTKRGANTDGNLSMIKRLAVKSKKGGWLTKKLSIYSSTLLSRLYLGVRTGI